MGPFNKNVDAVLERYGLDVPGWAMLASDLADLCERQQNILNGLAAKVRNHPAMKMGHPIGGVLVEIHIALTCDEFEAILAEAEQE